MCSSDKKSLDHRFKKYDIIAHTDGSSVGSGRTGHMKCSAASACFLELPDYEVQIGRHIGCATNNQAELSAIEIAINYALSLDYSRFLLVTDSRYCEGLLTRVGDEWEFKPQKNLELVNRTRELVLTLSKFTIVRVKGHRKENIGNENADKLAKECRKTESSKINKRPCGAKHWGSHR